MRNTSRNPAVANGSGRLRRSIIDFAAALALFWIIALAIGGATGQAFAVPLPAPSSAMTLDDTTATESISLYSATSNEAARSFQRGSAGGSHALLLLSIAFAAIFAFNLAFLRHLRRVYASPRRGVWRRGSQI